MCIRDRLGVFGWVDLNKITIRSGRKGTFERYDNLHLLGETNIFDVSKEQLGKINTITSFEVLEHCPAEFVIPILKQLHLLGDDDCEFIFSTPIFNGKAAKNHVNEMTRDLLGYMLEENGYTVVENYGTFASIAEYKPHLTEADLDIWNRLSKYHCVDFIANSFA